MRVMCCDDGTRVELNHVSANEVHCWSSNIAPEILGCLSRTRGTVDTLYQRHCADHNLLFFGGMNDADTSPNT